MWLPPHGPTSLLELLHHSHIPASKPRKKEQRQTHFSLVGSSKWLHMTFMFTYSWTEFVTWLPLAAGCDGKWSGHSRWPWVQLQGYWENGGHCGLSHRIHNNSTSQVGKRRLRERHWIVKSHPDSMWLSQELNQCPSASEPVGLLKSIQKEIDGKFHKGETHRDTPSKWHHSGLGFYMQSFKMEPFRQLNPNSQGTVVSSEAVAEL